MDILSFGAALATVVWWIATADPARRKHFIFRGLIPLSLLLTTCILLPHRAMVDKLLTRLAMPPGLLWLGMLVILGGALRARHRVGAAALAAGWLLITLAGNAAVGRALLGGLEAGVPTLAAAPVGLDAIAVLGGGTGTSPDGDPQLSHAGDRVRVTAAAWRRGIAPIVLTSGTSIAGIDQGGTRDLGAETRGVLVDMGVSADAVMTLPGPYNTSTEIAAIAEKAKTEGWDRVGLVTSAWHMPRAMRLAAARGLEVVPIGADYRGGRSPFTAVTLVPTGSGWYHNQTAAKEHLARLVGR